jgi:hypothetical protein
VYRSELFQPAGGAFIEPLSEVAPGAKQ